MMKPKKDVRPLQVRLPEDLYISLQYFANSSGRTLNSVVIECLNQSLPKVHPLSGAILNGDVSLYENHLKNALSSLDEYQEQIHNEISMLSSIIISRAEQAYAALEIAKDLRNGVNVDYYENMSNPESIFSLNPRRHKNAEEKSISLLKEVYRCRIESSARWKSFCHSLEKLSK